MICPKCKKYVALKLQNCPYCGHTLEAHTNPQDASNNVNPQGVSHPQYEIFDIDRTWFGVLMAILVGLIGLIVGLYVYPYDTQSRSTFIRGWATTFIATMLLAVIIVFIVVCCVSCQ